MKTSEPPAQPILSVDKRLLQEVLDGYSRWRAECRDVKDCYARWSEARRADAAVAFAACLSALDREQRAAEDLDRLISRLGAMSA